MARARSTQNLLIDRRLLEDIADGTDNPDLLKEIFRETWNLALGKITPDDFLEFCRLQPCVLWQGGRLQVRFRCQEGRSGIAVTRVVFTATRLQEPPLSVEDEILHSCGNNGATHTHAGACLNPAHLIRGQQEDRMDLSKARALAERLGLRLRERLSA